MSWEQKLSFPIKLKDGRWIRTCDEARAIILNLPERLQHSERWCATAERLMKVAEHGGDRSDLHLYLTQALRVDNMLAEDRPTRKRPR
jgi:hypothetical protein